MTKHDHATTHSPAVTAIIQECQAYSAYYTGLRNGAQAADNKPLYDLSAVIVDTCEYLYSAIVAHTPGSQKAKWAAKHLRRDAAKLIASDFSPLNNCTKRSVVGATAKLDLEKLFTKGTQTLNGEKVQSPKPAKAAKRPAGRASRLLNQPVA